MPHIWLARFTLWIMAALVAAVTAFGPTSAAAHPGHELHRHTATANIVAVSFDAATALVVASPVKTKASGKPMDGARFAAPAEQSREDHGNCGGACCSGSGCCSSACLTSPFRPITAPAGRTMRQPIPEGRAPDGVDPVAHLRPPRLLT